MAGIERDALLDAARGGDAAALEALLEQSQPRLYRFSLKMCGRPEDAQDILQDTLLAAARGIRGFRGAASVSTWLYTIARSFCIKKRRRPAHAPAVVSLEEEAKRAVAVEAPGPDPERSLYDRELGTALAAAIGELEPGAREVLVLRDVEGLSAGEVAQVTGLGVRAVKSRLHRARKAVRARMVPLLGARPAPPPRTRACPDVVDLLSRHLEGDIAPDTCAEMERHVAACPRCEGACASLRETLRLCRSTAPPELPETLKESIRKGIRALLAQDRRRSRPRGRAPG